MPKRPFQSGLLPEGATHNQGADLLASIKAIRTVFFSDAPSSSDCTLWQVEIDANQQLCLLPCPVLPL